MIFLRKKNAIFVYNFLFVEISKSVPIFGPVKVGHNGFQFRD